MNTKCYLTVAETSNIDWKKMMVKDEKKITEVVIPWNTKIEVAASDSDDSEKRTIKINNVSLFDHILHWKEKKYKILHMLTKPD